MESLPPRHSVKKYHNASVMDYLRDDKEHDTPLDLGD